MLIHIPQWPFVCTMVAHTLNHAVLPVVKGWKFFTSPKAVDPLNVCQHLKPNIISEDCEGQTSEQLQTFTQGQPNHDFWRFPTFPEVSSKPHGPRA